MRLVPGWVTALLDFVVEKGGKFCSESESESEYFTGGTSIDIHSPGYLIRFAYIALHLIYHGLCVCVCVCVCV